MTDFLSSGSLGVFILSLGCNSLASLLAFSNIILYTAIYTPLKQYHPLNTWVGSIVGAIPPMIGWAAGTGIHSLLEFIAPSRSIFTL